MGDERALSPGRFIYVVCTSVVVAKQCRRSEKYAQAPRKQYQNFAEIPGLDDKEASPAYAIVDSMWAPTQHRL